MKRRTYTPTGRTTGLVFAPNPCGAATQPLTDPNTGGSPVPAGTAFAAGPGQALAHPHVSLIFWGSWWAGNPLAAGVVSSVQALLAGPYLSYLAQYGVRRPDVRGATYVLDREPGNAFTDADVAALVTYLLDQDQVPEPDENYPNVYAVILPANSAYAGLAPYDPQPLPPGTVSSVLGTNSSIVWNDYDLGDVDNDPAHFLWVGNDGTLPYITTVFSHELAEIVTDPNSGDGVVQVAPQPVGGANQIGDVGTAWCDAVPGGRAQSYWSIADGALVLPTMYSVRRTLAGRSIGGTLPHTPSANTWIAAQF
ncbi:hypothetical protein ACFW1A_31255 [Kitasatospora sp. NPDC058965]|uniref:hypothetical protein n=1 Tax=Kitasatospora sp. NPDC058965 TaxID=3346682 RepID=UPI0036C14725